MRPKKIILIVVDSLRRDHVGCYGCQRDATPNIDFMAEHGILFENAFSVCPNTVPSIASILTSKHPGGHSVGFNPEGELNPQVDVTLASHLRAIGYKTAAFSGRGGLSGLSSGFDIFDDGVGPRGCLSLNEKLFDWLNENRTHDVFLLVHYHDTRGPYVITDTPGDMVVNDQRYGDAARLARFADHESTPNSIPRHQAVRGSDDVPVGGAGCVKDARQYRARYDAWVRHVDDAIGRLQQKMQELNIYDDSLIVVTSDHGEALGENNVFFEHGSSVTLDQIAVPLVIKPDEGGAYKRGSRSVPVSTLDIMPTVLSLCGLAGKVNALDGHSLEKCCEGADDGLLKTRTLLSENEGLIALVNPGGVMEIKRKDGPAGGHYPAALPLADALDGKKFFWKSGHECCLSMQFDQYQRYKLVSDIINKFRDGDSNQRYKILDVGANVAENLRKFLPFDDIYCLDKCYPPEYAQRINYLVGDITNYESEAVYDVVVSVDVYEHIPENSRKNFIDKLVGISRIATIIAAPFDTTAVKEYEVLVNEMYKLSHGIEHAWLHEHIQNGLPSLSYAVEVVKTYGLDYAVIPNGYLPRWHQMMMTCIMTEGMPEYAKIIKEVNEFYNNHFYCHDNRNPAYRHAIVVNKCSEKIDFLDLSSRGCESDYEFTVKCEMLQSFVKNILESFSNHRYRELKERQLKEQEARIVREIASQVAELKSNLSAYHPGGYFLLNVLAKRAREVAARRIPPNMLAVLRSISSPFLFRLRRDARIIAKSGLFDAAWYLKENPDIAASKIDPLQHYVRFGAAEGRNPHPHFDTRAYVERNPEVARSGMNPLAHSILHGTGIGGGAGTASAPGRDTAPG